MRGIVFGILFGVIFWLVLAGGIARASMGRPEAANVYVPLDAGTHGGHAPYRVELVWHTFDIVHPLAAGSRTVQPGRCYYLRSWNVGSTLQTRATFWLVLGTPPKLSEPRIKWLDTPTDFPCWGKMDGDAAQ